MAVLLPNGRQQFLDANGDPLANGTVAFYIPNTLVAKDTWSDPDQNTLNSNPITLDAGGYAIIYGAGSYRQIVKDEDGNLLWDALTSGGDGGGSGGGLNFAGTSAGSANAQTLAAASFNGEDGETITFIAGYTNTSATTLTVGAGSPIPIVRDGTLGPTALTGGEIAAENMTTLIYDTGRGAFHLVQTALSALGKSIVQSTNSVLIDGTATPSLLTLRYSNNGATPGPTLTLDRPSTSPAADDITAKILFSGRDSGGNVTDYVWLEGEIADPTDGSEDGQLRISTPLNGTGATRVIVRAGMYLGNPTGGDKGNGTINAETNIYVNNSPVLTQANYGATLIYSGSSAANTTFPVGSYVVFVSGTGNLNRNSAVTVRLSGSDTVNYLNDGAGAVLSGTWSVRGKVENSNGHLAQRIA